MSDDIISRYIDVFCDSACILCRNSDAQHRRMTMSADMQVSKMSVYIVGRPVRNGRKVSLLTN